MRTLLVGTMAGIAALVGFASSASASATVDLLWGGTTSTLVGAPSSGVLTLDIVLTAGATGVSGYTFTVSYDPTKVQVIGFNETSGAGNTHFGVTPLVGGPVDDGFSLQSFSGLANPIFAQGTGLNSGNTISLGTIQFHKLGTAGTFAVTPGFVNQLDAFANQSGQNIPAPIFNSAFLVNVPEPGTVSLLALGLSGLALAGRRRR